MIKVKNWSRRNFLKIASSGALALPLGAPALARAEARNLQNRSAEQEAKPAVRLNVRAFGATGNGQTRDTSALQMALDRCGVLGGGEVVVPAGKYLTGALVLRSNTTLRLEPDAELHGSPDLADYILTQVRWEGKWIQGYRGLLSATDAENVVIAGAGKIEGSSVFTQRVDSVSQLRFPALLEFVNCNNLRVADCATVQYGMWSIHPVYCEDLVFEKLSVKSGADGIDVDSCKHVVIDGCAFDTGDDCISLKSGRGAEGYALRRPTEDVHIANCTFTDHNWACIGIGSETSGGIRGVRVEHCRCVYAKTFAIYIKSNPGRGAYIEDILMRDLDIAGAELGFLRLNFLTSGKQDEVPVPGLQGIPSVRNLCFERIRVRDVPILVKADEIDARKPLDGLVLKQISGTCGKGIFLANIRNVILDQIQVTGYAGPLVSAVHTTGRGLQGAASLAEPPAGEVIPAPALPYVLQ
jgi:polygalacturonase